MPALKYCVGKSFEAGVTVCVSLYGSECETLQFDEDDYENVMDRVTLGGMTSFKAAFVEIQKQMKLLRKAEPPVEEFVIAFMTDGQVCFFFCFFFANQNVD